MKDKTWIPKKYDEWKNGKYGREGSITAFAAWLGVEYPAVRSWILNGKMPDTWDSVQALLTRYGDDARRALGIDTQFVFLDRWPPRMEKLLRLAVDEVNFELMSRGIDADTSEAEALIIHIFEKYGFNKTTKERLSK